MKHLIITFFAVLLTAANVMATQPSPMPDQIHLTWTGDPATTVTIQWRTDMSISDSTVNYGTTSTYGMSGQGIAFQLSGTTVTDTSYTQVVMHHVVELQGLSPLTTYHYQAGGGGQFSRDYYFTTGPVTGFTDSTFNFIVCGDTRGNSLGAFAGINPSLSSFASALSNRHPSFIIFTGDATEGGHIDEWDDWFQAMSSISPYVVIMPVDGNHESNSTVFYAQFAVPFANGKTWQNLSTKGFYYSFNYGNAHFTIADDETAFGVPVETDEVTWLTTDLQSTQATNAEWKFVSNHMPEFAAGAYGSNSVLDQYWVPVFVNNNVDMVFNGHCHFYERTFPLDQSGNQVLQNAGVTYVVAGSIGAPLYDITQAPFIAYEEKTYNYADVHIAGNTISMDAYRLSDTPSNNYNTLMDSLSYTKLTPSSGTGSAGCSCNTTGNSNAYPFDAFVVVVMLGAGLLVFKKLLGYPHMKKN
ncbi:MAG: metallophosphoesterase family protein [Deltaproteobacteria bacterium]|nr:metallophosphoesterase family protein [Deltaproteobacteria bacterium]